MRLALGPTWVMLPGKEKHRNRRAHHDEFPLQQVRWKRGLLLLLLGGVDRLAEAAHLAAESFLGSLGDSHRFRVAGKHPPPSEDLGDVPVDAGREQPDEQDCAGLQAMPQGIPTTKPTPPPTAGTVAANGGWEQVRHGLVMRSVVGGVNARNRFS